MELKQIDYDTDLNSKQKEIYNFQKVAGHLADYGFNCIKLDDDWQGADFLAYHKDQKHTLKVQLKSRFNLDKKYHGKSLFVTFPIEGNWYLIEHDTLVKLVKKHTTHLETKSWNKSNGSYSNTKPNQQLINSIAKWKLNIPETLSGIKKD
jgi:hypothetical protein